VSTDPHHEGRQPHVDLRCNGIRYESRHRLQRGLLRGLDALPGIQACPVARRQRASAASAEDSCEQIHAGGGVCPARLPGRRPRSEWIRRVGRARAQGGSPCAEEQLGGEVRREAADDGPLLAWLPRSAATMLCRYRTGADGKTAEQRRTGRRWRRPVVLYGERVMFRPLGIGKKNKDDYEARVREGLYVGHHERTSGLLILTQNGLIAGKTFMRVPADRRWMRRRRGGRSRPALGPEA
jgi:hypothetical protein